MISVISLKTRVVITKQISQLISVVRHKRMVVKAQQISVISVVSQKSIVVRTKQSVSDFGGGRKTMVVNFGDR